ncbi:MAG: ComF family protein [Dehalococcoidia bacterium]|nr:ComF family protein [Dehalococcoidia bacterium]
MTLSLGGIGRAAIDLLYPPRCAICGRGGDFLCRACRDALPAADGLRCDVCWQPVRQGASCRACTDHPLALSRVRCAYRYEGEVRRLVRAFKFGGQSSLAASLAAPMGDVWRQQGFDADLIVPVPLLHRRERERGYNQSLLLARELSKATGAPVSEALSRLHSRAHQAESAGAEERWANVKGAFAVALPGLVAGKRVAVVDDITTTGATLDACARALIDGGADEVLGLTLARED